MTGWVENPAHASKRTSAGGYDWRLEVVNPKYDDGRTVTCRLYISRLHTLHNQPKQYYVVVPGVGGRSFPTLGEAKAWAELELIELFLRAP